MKNIGNLFFRLFVISLLTFRYFSTIVSLFGVAAPFFYGSSSKQTVSAAPAPTKMCRLRPLRLRIPGQNYFGRCEAPQNVRLTL